MITSLLKNALPQGEACVLSTARLALEVQLVAQSRDSLIEEQQNPSAKSGSRAEAVETTSQSDPKATGLREL